MEIKIYEKEKNIYFSNNENEYLMNFDNLVVLAKAVIDTKKSDSESEFNIKCDNALELYKTTINKLINDILTDEELLDLLNQEAG